MAPAKVPNRFGTLRYRGLGPVLVRVWVLPSVEPSPQHEAYGSLGSATMIVFLVPKRLREHLSSMLFMVHQSVSCHTDKNSWFQLFEVVLYTYLYSIYMAKSLSNWETNPPEADTAPDTGPGRQMMEDKRIGRQIPRRRTQPLTQDLGDK